VFMPGIVAVAMTARAGGRRGVAALLGRLVDWQVSARWYLFAIGYMAAVKLAVAVTHRAALGEWPRFGDQPWYLMFAAALGSTLIGGQAGEETGWRGFLLPELARRFGLPAAGILVGVVWALWHLPLFYSSVADTFGQSFPLYLMQVTALSVAMTWLCVRTRGSLVPVMLLHAAVNNTKDIVPSAGSSPVSWLTVAALWIGAGWFLVRLHRMATSPAAERLRRQGQDPESTSRGFAACSEPNDRAPSVGNDTR
jgi:uncharacterized protein